MKLLAQNGSMTASALARELGLNQSSVSRLLQSLIQAGFVYKPSFQQFKLDYGILTFAGIALDHFPLVSIGAKCCNSIHDQYGCAVTVGVLHEEHLLYLALVAEHADSQLRVVNGLDFPLHISSLGLLLSYVNGRKFFFRAISNSLKQLDTGKTVDELYDLVDDIVRNNNFMFLPSSLGRYNKFNAAIPFEYDGQLAALAIYSEEKDFSAKKCQKILENGLTMIGVSNPLSK
jgi:DNA-binding IclR family transcriptional regulator